MASSVLTVACGHSGRPGEASFELQWPQATSYPGESWISALDENCYSLAITLRAYENDDLVAERNWQHRYPRTMA